MTIQHLKNLKKIEDKIKSSQDWPKLCRATSKTDRSCSQTAFQTPLSALTAMGINNLDTVTQEELDLAFQRFF